MALALLGFWYLGPLRRTQLPPTLKVLIFSASIGEGHDLPARVLAEGIEREAPGTEIEIVDSLEVVGWLTRRLVMDSSRFHSKWGSRLFDLSYRLITDVRPTRWFAARPDPVAGGKVDP